MIQLIWCLECEAGSVFEEETDVVRHGRVVKEDVRCHECREPLAQGTQAVAVSICERPEDYRPWEHEYLAMLNEPERPKDERPSPSPYQEDEEGRSGGPTPAKVTSHDNAWPIISMYTRSQAMADGVLVDVTPTAHEAGFRYPVAVTCGVWAECIAVPPGVEGQDESGRLWDVLTMLAFAARMSKPEPGSEVCYRLHVRNDNRDEEPPLVELVGVCGPGDDGSPCVTVMLPGED